MLEQLHGSEELMTNITPVVEATQLSFARGSAGQRYPLTTDQQKAEFARECDENTFNLTKFNTADCGDDRLTLALADGTTDPAALRNRIVSQLFGGEGLAATKALVAANAVAIRDAKNFTEAYMIVSNMLVDLDEEDGGHAACGASNAVEASVAKAIDFDLLLPTVGLLVPDRGDNGPLLQKNIASKRERLDAGFYGTWDAKNHEDYLASRFPQNFSFLKVDPADHEASGHDGSGLYVITQENVGYRKTGRAFGVTVPKMRELAYKLGGSDEERRRILLGFVDDTVHVGSGIVTKNFPVFAQAA